MPTNKPRNQSSPLGTFGRADLAPVIESLLRELPAEFTDPKLLGVGGIGFVVAVREKSTARLLAIKFTPRDSLIDKFGAYLSELTKLGPDASDAHLLLPLRIIETQSALLEVFPYIEHVTTLRELVESDDLTLESRLEIMAQVAEGLCYLHNNNVIHGDIKPANILVKPAPRLHAYLADFGWAHRTGSSRALVVGTFAYMHPHLRSGFDAVSRSSQAVEVSPVARFGPGIDLFSFGITLGELLSGSRRRLDPGSAEIESIVLVAAPSMPEVQDEIAKLLRMLRAVAVDEASVTTCRLPEQLRRIAIIAKMVNRDSQQRSSEVVRTRRAMLEQDTLPGVLQEYTRIFLVGPEGPVAQSRPLEAAVKSEAVLGQLRRDNRRVFNIAVGMTVMSFALVVGLVVAAVLVGVLSDRDGWAVVLGGAGGLGAIVAYLWKPFDKIYDANLMSMEIALVTAKAAEALDDPDPRKQAAFVEAIAEIRGIQSRRSLARRAAGKVVGGHPRVRAAGRPEDGRGGGS